MPTFVVWTWLVRPGARFGRRLYAQALGVYGYAAVPRAGLWPATPHLCRYAVHTKRLGSECYGYAKMQDTLR